MSDTISVTDEVVHTLPSRKVGGSEGGWEEEWREEGGIEGGIEGER